MHVSIFVWLINCVIGSYDLHRIPTLGLSSIDTIGPQNGTGYSSATLLARLRAITVEAVRLTPDALMKAKASKGFRRNLFVSRGQHSAFESHTHNSVYGSPESAARALHASICEFMESTESDPARGRRTPTGRWRATTTRAFPTPHRQLPVALDTQLLKENPRSTESVLTFGASCACFILGCVVWVPPVPFPRPSSIVSWSWWIGNIRNVVARADTFGGG